MTDEELESGRCPRHPECRPHPLLSHYGPIGPGHPRIFVVGREPDADRCMDGSVGEYRLR